MFGPIMCFKTRSGIQIEMAPLSRDVMEQFIEDGGMQRYQVHKFLGRIGSPVLEDEYEWYDKVRTSRDDVVWGIFIKDQEGRKLIGSTGLHNINGQDHSPYKSATSGFMIFRTEWWGQGIASACHRTRTMYAFDVLGLVIINSKVIFENEASRRAVEGVGYLVRASSRMPGLYHGEVRNDDELRVINPDKYAWQYWWRNETVPDEARAARKKTQAALKWARTHVRYT